MANWLQNRIKVAEGLLEAVDRTAKEQAEATLGRGERLSSRQEQSREVAANSKHQVAPGTKLNGTKPSTSGLSPSIRSRDSSPQGKSKATPENEALQRPPAETGASLYAAHEAPLAEPQGPLQPELGNAADSAKRSEEISASPLKLNMPSAPNAGEQGGTPHVASSSGTQALSVENPDQAGSSVPSSLTSSLNQSTADAVTRAILAAADRSGQTGEAEGQEMVGQGKELRLGRMVESMKKKVDQVKAENAQLEELLRQAEAASHASAGQIGRLEDELAQARSEGSSARAELITGKEEWQREKANLKASLEDSRAQNTRLQSQLQNATETSERLAMEQEASETRMLTALRADIVEVEQRLEDERFAAASARQGFAAREHELEASLAESAAALTGQQRVAESAGQRLASAEQRAGIADAEAGRLREQLQELETQLRRLDAGNSGRSGLKGQEMEERVASLQAALSNSESKRLGLESEVANLRASLEDARKQPLTSASSLEQDRRLQEVTDLLYEKQSLLERLSAERAAQQMAWEQQLVSIQSDADRVKRRVKTEKASGSLEEGTIVCIEDMGETYQRLANNERVGKAVKASARFLDRTTFTAIKFLRQYPIARLLVVAYIVFIHLFVYTLIHHLQQKALDVHPLRLDDG